MVAPQFNAPYSVCGGRCAHNFERMVRTGAGARKVMNPLTHTQTRTPPVHATETDAAKLGYGKSIEACVVDVGDANQVREKAAELGPVTMLVNNAGVASVRSLLELTDAHIEWCVCVRVCLCWPAHVWFAALWVEVLSQQLRTKWTEGNPVGATARQLASSFVSAVCKEGEWS